MSASVSLVLEWETVLEGRRERGDACLRALHRQLCELAAAGRSCELIVCFDADQASGESVRAAIDRAADGRDWPGRLLIAESPTPLDYYAKKNYGFTLTTGEIVVFIDSDLTPEPDWLRNLLAPFAEFRTSAVVGRTHLETGTVYERAVALFWIFDERDDASPVRRTRRLVSNNVAFRRALFAHFPFPDRPTYRGQCSELAAILEARRIPLYEQPSARASHPAPAGSRRYFERAFRAGVDQCFYDALDRRATLVQCARNWTTDMRHVTQRIERRRPLIRTGALDAAAAFTLGLAYYATKAAGYCSALWRDRRIERVNESRPTPG